VFLLSANGAEDLKQRRARASFDETLAQEKQQKMAAQRGNS
jgi:hypothetical protein